MHTRISGASGTGNSSSMISNITLNTLLQAMLGEDSQVYALVVSRVHGAVKDLEEAVSTTVTLSSTGTGTVSTNSALNHSYPSIDKCNKVRKLKKYIEDACVSHAGIVKEHLQLDTVQLEIRKWQNEMLCRNMKTEYVSVLVQMCILVRDLVEIQGYVLAAWHANGRFSGIDGSIDAQGGVAQSEVKDRMLQCKRKRNEKRTALQDKAKMIVRNIAQYKTETNKANKIQHACEWKTKDSLASMYWTTVVERLNTEAKLCVSVEIVKSGHDTKKAFEDMARNMSVGMADMAAVKTKPNMLTPTNKKRKYDDPDIMHTQDEKYTTQDEDATNTTRPIGAVTKISASDIEKWYQKGWEIGSSHSLEEVEMMCAASNYAAKTGDDGRDVIIDYCNIAPVPCMSTLKPIDLVVSNEVSEVVKLKENSKITMRELEIVVYYCSTLMCRIQASVLEKILPLSRVNVTEIVDIYAQLRESTKRQQDVVLNQLPELGDGCWLLYQHCLEIEMSLRMFVHMHTKNSSALPHAPSTSSQDNNEEEGQSACIESIKAYAMDTPFFATHDNFECLLQKWITSRDLLISNCKMTAALLLWGQDAFIYFCMRSNKLLSRSRPNGYITIQEEGDDAANYEYFTSIEMDYVNLL
jgi:hypothetical protein